MFAIAYGLGVPPVQPMLPYKEKTLVRIVGAQPPVGATDLYNWITGYAPLDETDPVTYRLELPRRQSLSSSSTTSFPVPRTTASAPSGSHSHPRNTQL